MTKTTTMPTTNIATTRTTKKRSSITDVDKEKKTKFKRTTSDSEKTPDEENFCLNEFYLETSLCILTSALNYHRCLFNENDLHLCQTFQTLSGASDSCSSPF